MIFAFAWVLFVLKAPWYVWALYGITVAYRLMQAGRELEK